ncbi:M1 family metallopeptidase [Paremcibacter congregatus]|uniref:Aminopeptidase n=1 Tax=Paremcibacter congregatus TaxID=2043170 RepID=A0A2G4YR90_9PROT|nr:M1 family metallopeptidase [Paremcibacter congregatus]PHZ84790.1 aminopeptidase [Paremcibacter congregatus]QDE26242.1 M1 family metallopeptidase [Paremcibacter congregatus]
MIKVVLKITTVLICSMMVFGQVFAAGPTNSIFDDKFRQLEEILPTPNGRRTASGMPGPGYWQQQVDYKIDVQLDENKRDIAGSVRISYHNKSPDTLEYIWLELGQNRFRDDALGEQSSDFAGLNWGGYPSDETAATQTKPGKINLKTLRRQQFMDDHQLGYRIQTVTTASGTKLPYTIVGTLMRIDLPKALKPGSSFRFSVSWSFSIFEANAVGGRSGYETFSKDEHSGGNDIFLIAQWFPRLVAYSDYEGWHNKEFIRRGEFTLEFGNYDVSITVPADHVVSATGELQNAGDVLTRIQRTRLKQARTATKPIFIVTPQEALENEKAGTRKRKTWRFKAKGVRDFAWASSRKFIWNAMGHQQASKDMPLVMVMCFYPKEGQALWTPFAAAAVAHTLEVYSRFTFDYPYPVAQAVNGPNVVAMEYPMIGFNSPRPTKQDDGTYTYSRLVKRTLIGEIIHEVGHNYFPMIINSDERRWGWMDEGLNSFLQLMAEYEWNPDASAYQWKRGEPGAITSYMTSPGQVPIMTNSNSSRYYSYYGKPAVALTILRETIMGRDLFDFAFKKFAAQWKFKRPTPADFFRVMEETSGVDLDWFWRGWFYSTDHVDISLDRVSALLLDTKNPDVDFVRRQEEQAGKPEAVTVRRNRAEGRAPRILREPWLKGFYDENDLFTISNQNRNQYQDFLSDLNEIERQVFQRALKEDKIYYVLEFSNKGGLVMPIILRLTYTDGSMERIQLPAEIWRNTPGQVKKLLIRDKEIKYILVDPDLETADADTENNHYPRRIIPMRLETFKGGKKARDLMKDMKATLKVDPK